MPEPGVASSSPASTALSGPSLFPGYALSIHRSLGPRTPPESRIKSFPRGSGTLRHREEQTPRKRRGPSHHRALPSHWPLPGVCSPPQELRGPGPWHSPASSPGLPGLPVQQSLRESDGEKVRLLREERMQDPGPRGLRRGWARVWSWRMSDEQEGPWAARQGGGGGSLSSTTKG